jgi:cephalosporin hydroxylase
LTPKIVCDIGSDKGGNAFLWCKNLTTVKKAVFIEYRGVPFAKEISEMFPHIEFLFIQGSSYDPQNVDSVKKFLGTDRIDFLFIDGDKTAFAKDFYNFKPMVKSGGIACMHDINGEPPEDDFKMVSKTEKTFTIIDGSEYDEWVASGKKPTSAWESWLEYWKKSSCGVGVIQL